MNCFERTGLSLPIDGSEDSQKIRFDDIHEPLDPLVFSDDEDDDDDSEEYDYDVKTDTDSDDDTVSDTPQPMEFLS